VDKTSRGRRVSATGTTSQPRVTAEATGDGLGTRSKARSTRDEGFLSRPQRNGERESEEKRMAVVGGVLHMRE
jgi:hypothetical protein